MTNSSPTPNLKDRRLKAGKTIDEVAATIGVSSRTYIRWEQDEVRPGGDNLIALAAYWRVAPKTLYPTPEPSTVGK